MDTELKEFIASEVDDMMDMIIDDILNEEANKMIKNDIEFELGDEITYKPYETPMQCKVVGVDVPKMPAINVESDPRIFYEVAFIENDKITGTVFSTSGLCIKQSKYFEEHDANGESV